MGAKRFITVNDGKIVALTESSHIVGDLSPNQLYVTQDELDILRACNGNLDYAKHIIVSIEERIGRVR